MLEHANRDDAIEFRCEVTIILERELHASVEPGRLRPLDRQRVLLLRERYAHDLDVRDLRQVARETAPAGADVEHLHSRLQVQLRCDEPALVALCGFKRLALIAEVGAGVEQLLVEEQLVERVAEIVVVGDVLLRLADRVRLLEALEAARDATQDKLHRLRAERETVHREQRQECAEPGIGEGHTTVHIRFAGVQFRIEEQLAVEARIGQPHVGRRPRLSAAEDMRLPFRVDDVEGADLHERGQHFRQWKHGVLQSP